MTLLWMSAVQTTAILLIAVVVLPLLRRRSAALRHWVLASALLFSAATPAFNLLMPSWSVPARIASAIPHPQSPIAWKAGAEALVTSEGQSSAVALAEPKAAPRVISTRQLMLAIWLAVALGGLAFLCVGLLRLRRLASRSTPVGEPWRNLADQVSRDYALPRPVQLLQSQNPSVLVTWGVAQPKILLPKGAESWSPEIANIVLRHELAHIRRRDWVVQMIAQSLRILHWFNPLIWIVCRRLRLEAEIAADDAVLITNIHGHDYARHLLSLARSLNTTDRAWSAVLTMARPSTLERRFAAMLNPNLNRNPLTPFAGRLTLVLGLSITASLPAMKTFAAAPQPASQRRVEPAQPAIAPGTSVPVQRPLPQARPLPADQALPDNEAELEKYIEQLVSQAPKGNGLKFREDEIERIIAEANKIVESIRPGTLPGVFGSQDQTAAASGESTGMLIKLFDTSNDAEMKKHILGYLGMSGNPQAAEKVLAIARSDADKDMQREAIGYVGFRSNAYDQLVSIYDTSKVSETRKYILGFLGMSGDPRVNQKLFSIAQSDPDPELRREAVDYLAMR